MLRIEGIRKQENGGACSEDGKTGKLAEIPREKIRPRADQPRKFFEEEALQSLAQSIRENGILQPLLVRKIEKGMFELIAGERRFRASEIAGLVRVPCLIVAASDHHAAVCSLLENLQRQDLSLFEESAAIAALIEEYGFTQEMAAQKLGMAQSTLANKLRLLRFSEQERALLLQYGLTERHARALLRVEDLAVRMELIREVGEKQLTVARTEQLVRIRLEESTVPKRAKPILVVKDVRIFLNTVSRAVEVMRGAGIPAEQSRLESDEFFEYVIRIPKSASVKKPPERMAG